MTSGMASMTPRETGMSARCPGRRGFTLVETLAVLAALALLLALTLPALRMTRSSAAQAGSLANIRQHLQVFSMYNADFDLHMPYFTRPDGMVWFDIEGRRVWADYFMASGVWHLALGDMYYEGRKHSPVFCPPGFIETELPPGVLLTVTEYCYAPVFLTDPAYWTYGRREGPSQWRATRASEIQHPSKKAVFFERWPFLVRADFFHVRRDGDYPAIGFADGSAQRYHVDKIRSGYMPASGESTPYHYVRLPAMNTVMGVHGRDVD